MIINLFFRNIMKDVILSVYNRKFIDYDNIGCIKLVLMSASVYY